MNADPRRLVAEGYDAVAERYLEWGQHSPTRALCVERLVDLLSDHSRVLDLGCGNGTPVANRLVQAHAVTGVDGSAAQVELARRLVPSATFFNADMTEIVFPEASFDAVVAFYSIIHVPRKEHGSLLKKIASWLRPGGVFVGTFGARDDPGSIEDDWLGAPMYWSFFDAQTNRRLVGAAGLRILRDEIVTEEEDGRPVSFLWLLAQKRAAD